MQNGNNYMQNRELSWLRFNERILEEAMDVTVPLLERLKFIEIFTSNLDEFFMIRVGSLHDLSRKNPNHIDLKSGMNPKEQLEAIYQAVRPLYAKREQCFFDIVNQLRDHGIQYLTHKELMRDDIKYIKQYFKHSVVPLLSPQIVDSHHPFPHLQNKSLYIVARLKYKGKETFGCIPIPAALPSVVYLPDPVIRFLTISEIIQEYTEQLFPGYTCIECVQLCLSRNADIHADNDFNNLYVDFRKTMQLTISKRHCLTPVRLELSHSISAELELYLCSKIPLEHRQVYITNTPLHFKFVYELGNQLTEAKRNLLSYSPFAPQLFMYNPHGEKLSRFLETSDVLLSFPYESMKPFLQLLKEASVDPDVLSIKITIYRLSRNAKLVDYLCSAAENGKHVTVLIELRARFDEQNNIDWSERLEEAGCTIIYGFQDYKVHSKICLITKNNHGTVFYLTQIGSGNYNEKTVSMYTDLSLLTANQEIGRDANAFFQNMMIGNLNGSYKHLLVAPTGLKSRLLSMIQEEIKKGEQGRILLKVNAVTDLDIIKKLRDASRAGVKITMIVRGICCILPNVPNETENLHVRSIVGRFLEHSRIYCFGSGNDEKMYLSSADFMSRNMQRRVEIACPIYDVDVRAKIHHILDLSLQDNVRARVLRSDGTYCRILNDNTPVDCQQQLMEDSFHVPATASVHQTFWQKLKTLIK